MEDYRYIPITQEGRGSIWIQVTLELCRDPEGRPYYVAYIPLPIPGEYQDPGPIISEEA